MDPSFLDGLQYHKKYGVSKASILASAIYMSSNFLFSKNGSESQTQVYHLV